MQHVAEAEARRRILLEESVGQQVLDFVDSDHITDILLNADGKIWIDSTKYGRHFSEITIEPHLAATILRLVASHMKTPITARSPILDNAQLPKGQRMAGTIFPVTEAPTFAVRLPHSGEVDIGAFRGSEINVPRVDEVVSFGPSGDKLERLLSASARKKNIIIAGATGSGKTTLFNCLLKAMLNDRLCVIEDAKELVIPAIDHVRFLSIKDVVSMDDLLVLALRYRPDRIIVGEIRTALAAKMFVRATNTGHKGSAATIHASAPDSVMMKLEDFCASGSDPLPARSLKDSVDIIVFTMQMEDKSRCITDIISLNEKPIKVREAKPAVQKSAKTAKKVSSKIISFTQAKAQELKEYFSGEPCSRGHVAKRTVVGKKCVKCLAEDARREREEKAAARLAAAEEKKASKLAAEATASN